jgi:hypothetical protein
MITGSTLSLASKCSASHALQRVASMSDEAAVGSAGHEHLEQRVTLGYDAAFDNLPEVVRKWGLSEDDAGNLEARLRSFGWLPPSGASPEQSLALLADGSVIEVEGGRGMYEAPGAIFAMTIDLVWHEGEMPWVADYKFGDSRFVTPIEQNMQLRAAAFMASKRCGAQQVIPAIVYPGKGEGIWDVPGQPLGPDDFKQIEAEIRDAVARVDMAREAFKAGTPLALVEGPHCTYCPAQARCPAKTALIKGALDGELAPQGDAPLTAEQAIRLAEAMPTLRRFVDRADKALRAHVDLLGPLTLSDGKLWGPYEVRRSDINPSVGTDILAGEISDEWARDAVEVSLSRKGIEGAIKLAHEANGIKRKVAATLRKVMAKIDEAGGILRRVETWYGPHETKKLDAPEGEE